MRSLLRPNFPTELARRTPATTAAPEEPKPRPRGIGLMMWIYVVGGNVRWPWHLRTYSAVRVMRLASAASGT